MPFTYNVLNGPRKKCTEDAVADTIAIAHDDDLQLINSEDVVSSGQNQIISGVDK